MVKGCGSCRVVRLNPPLNTRDSQHIKHLRKESAGGGSRTHTALRPTDFESAASAIPPLRRALDSTRHAPPAKALLDKDIMSRFRVTRRRHQNRPTIFSDCGICQGSQFPRIPFLRTWYMAPSTRLNESYEALCATHAFYSRRCPPSA